MCLPNMHIIRSKLFSVVHGDKIMYNIRQIAMRVIENVVNLFIEKRYNATCLQGHLVMRGHNLIR